MSRKAVYTDRPLTEEERIFASEAENYKQLFTFMKRNGLNQEEWYDILIIPYLQAVKKYCSREELHIYPFWSILTRVLSCAYHHHFRSMNAKRNKAVVISLDVTLQGDNPFSEYSIDEWWIDNTQQVERIVLDKEMLLEIMFSLNNCQSMIFEMLLAGYSKKEIREKTELSICMFEKELKSIRTITLMCLR